MKTECVLEAGKGREQGDGNNLDGQRVLVEK